MPQLTIKLSKSELETIDKKASKYGFEKRAAFIRMVAINAENVQPGKVDNAAKNDKISIPITKKDLERIDEKAEAFGFKNRSDYVRYVASHISNLAITID